MQVAVMGHFRVPLDRLEEARPKMKRLIEATRAEAGCITYAFSEDLMEPGMMRVSELWESREHLSAHVETQHMAVWAEERKELGLTDRQIGVYTVGEKQSL